MTDDGIAVFGPPTAIVVDVDARNTLASRLMLERSDVPRRAQSRAEQTRPTGKAEVGNHVQDQ